VNEGEPEQETASAMGVNQVVRSAGVTALALVMSLTLLR
jgi:hypothetical protein